MRKNAYFRVLLSHHSHKHREKATAVVKLELFQHSSQCVTDGRDGCTQKTVRLSHFSRLY